MMEENVFNKIQLGVSVWDVPARYENLNLINSGAFGQVCKAKDRVSDCHVAIKKLNHPFLTEKDAKQAYREFELLVFMEHENVIGIIDGWTTATSYHDLRDLYFVMPLIDYDMKTIIKQITLTDEHVKIIIYQLLRGLKYIHSIGVIHRDLKPANIGIQSNWQLKILDLGLARPAGLDMSWDVATIWYRAPEIILNWSRYDYAVDIWSVGCIMAEMMLKEPLFKGNNDFNQLRLIIDLCGTPDKKFISKVPCKEAQEYLKGLPKRSRCNFEKFFGDKINCVIDPRAIDLLNTLLQFDPSRRPTAKKALRSRYLSNYHDSKDEPTGKVMDSSFEKLDLQVSGWKEKIFGELQLLTSIGYPYLTQSRL